MALRFDEIQLARDNHKFYPKLKGVDSYQYVQIQTSHGYLRLGPNNSSYGFVVTFNPEQLRNNFAYIGIELKSKNQLSLYLLKKL